MRYDVVIIGGGLAGLTAALKLSKEGKKVAVLEKHHMPGGYATNFKRKDNEGNTYIFDVALHGIGGLRENNPFNIILKDKLGILDNIKLLEKPETATILTLNGMENDIPSNFEAFKSYLTNKYYSNKDDLDKLFNFLLDLKDDMLEVTKLGNKMPKYNDYLQSITLDKFLREYTNNEALIEEFSFLWLYYGLPPKKLNALYYLLPWISYHIGGTFYIEGGAGKLSDTLAKIIEENGSKVFLSSEVKFINSSSNKILSVVTKKGFEFEADNFIIACDPNQIFGMINNSKVQIDKYKDKLNSLEVGISLTQLYLGLDCKSTDIGINKGDYFVEVAKNQQSYENIISGNYADMSFGITSYDILDPTLNAANIGCLAICIGDVIDNWPEYNSEEYKLKKASVSNILIDKVDKIFPGLRKHIKVMELGTPHTMKRYTNNSQGAVYGWAQSVLQGGVNRLSFKTPFENTLLAGSWTNPGGGFEGAMTSGVMAAERLLKQLANVDTNVINDTKSCNNENLMDPKIFVIGMAASVNSKKSKGIDFTIKFDFNKDGQYYVRIKNGKAKVISNEDKADLTIMTDYKTWYDIGFNNKDGANAYLDGEIKINGPVELFIKTQEIFTPSNEDKNDKSLDKSTKVERKKLNSMVWMNLALIPWIIYWSIGKYLPTSLLIAISTVYLCVFILFIKPNDSKEITLLESGSLILFSTYGFLSTLNISSIQMFINSYLDIGLIILFIISVVINKPITADYSKLEYSMDMAKTKLFTTINNNITIIWIIVFSLVFIVKLSLDGYIENIAYVFIAIGLIASYIYPKRVMRI